MKQSEVDARNAFYSLLYKKQQEVFEMPSNKEIYGWATHVLDLLFPERNSKAFTSEIQIMEAFKTATFVLEDIMNRTKACQSCDTHEISIQFFNSIIDLYELMNTDADALVEGDPAAISKREVIRTYPGFFAVSMYRIAHALHGLGVPLIPRVLTEYAHSRTGIDIHPAAKIGHHLYIDHGTGLVIGETCQIGNYVKLYQGVTLGALSVEKVLANTKRHPTLEDHVIIYSGATILGGETTIGKCAVVGGNVWLTSSIDPYTVVYHQAHTKIIDSKTQV